jgi:predicted transcriptional regulator YheO
VDQDEQSLRRAEAFALCQQMARMIVATFGSICEVVVHDFRDIEHSVVHIDGNVTDRAVGDGPTDLLLKAVRAGQTSADLYGYTGYTLDGKVLRSSSMFLRDPDGKVFGALCVNVDTTHLSQLDAWLAQMLHGGTEVSETFTSTVGEALDVMLAEAAQELGVPLAQATRTQKIRLVHALHERGAFEIKKAVSFVAERLGVSRFTIYNYLNSQSE